MNTRWKSSLHISVNASRFRKKDLRSNKLWTVMTVHVFWRGSYSDGPRTASGQNLRLASARCICIMTTEPAHVNRADLIKAAKLVSGVGFGCHDSRISGNDVRTPSRFFEATPVFLEWWATRDF
jgi:hypothetical protein